MIRRYCRTVKVTMHKSRSSFVLDYFLLEDKFPISKRMGVVTYGVSVVKSENGVVETADAASLFTDENDAAELLELMARNSVTPVAMPGIVEDFLAEGAVKRELAPRRVAVM